MNNKLSLITPPETFTGKELILRGGMTRALDSGEKVDSICPFVYKDIITLISKHLFGRGSENYAGSSILSHLRALISFAQCNKYISKVVFEYITLLVADYQKDLISLDNRECFKIQDTDRHILQGSLVVDNRDGVQVMMLNLIKDDGDYASQLMAMYIDKLTSSISDESASPPIVFMCNLRKILEAPKANAANSLLKAFCRKIYAFLSNDQSTWEEKMFALRIMHGFFREKISDYCKSEMHQILMIFIDHLDIFFNPDWASEPEVLGIINDLIKNRRFKDLPSDLLDKILINIEGTFDSEDQNVVQAAIGVIQSFIRVDLELSSEQIERIIFKSFELFNKNNLALPAVFLVCTIAQKGLLKKLSSQFIEKIVLKIEELLNSTPRNHYYAKKIFCAFGEAGMKKWVSDYSIQSLFNNAANFLFSDNELNQNEINQRSYWAVINIGALAEADLLPPQHLEKFISKLESLFNHKNWTIALQSMCAAISIKGVDSTLILNKITEEQVRFLHEEMLKTFQKEIRFKKSLRNEMVDEFEPFYPSIRPGFIELFAILSKHQNANIREFICELIPHVEKVKSDLQKWYKQWSEM